MYHYFLNDERFETEYKSLNEAVIKEDANIPGDYSLLVTATGPIPKEFYLKTNDSIGFTYGVIEMYATPHCTYGGGGGGDIGYPKQKEYVDPEPIGYMIEPNEGPDWMSRVNYE